MILVPSGVTAEAILRHLPGAFLGVCEPLYKTLGMQDMRYGTGSGVKIGIACRWSLLCALPHQQIQLA